MRPEFRGAHLIHGHVHDLWRVLPYQGRLQVNVGIDAWGGVPVSEETIIDILDMSLSDIESLEERLAWPNQAE